MKIFRLQRTGLMNTNFDFIDERICSLKMLFGCLLDINFDQVTSCIYYLASFYFFYFSLLMTIFGGIKMFRHEVIFYKK